MRTVDLTVNGRTVSRAVEPRMSLADFLRETENLTGTHLGCEHGACGACTLLIDGVPARSCITLAAACGGARITTIEGLDGDELAGELRVAFSAEHALQCGYCTPGMLVSARDAALRLETADEHEIRVAMSGNLCRCTGYVGIVRAIGAVIADRRARGIGPLGGAGRTELGPAGARPGSGATEAEPVSTPSPAVAAPAPKTAAKLAAPQTVVEKSFGVAFPREAVWAFFLSPSAVAACLPGASITEESAGGNLAGKMKVKLGPIVAEFNGAATIDRDPSSFTGTIRGSGVDGRSRSTARGEIAYRLIAEGPQATRVEISIGYTLTGTLAQFSRSRLVQDIVDRLTGIFVANLRAALARGGARPGTAPAALNAGGLFFSAVAGQFRNWLRRLGI